MVATGPLLRLRGGLGLVAIGLAGVGVWLVSVGVEVGVGVRLVSVGLGAEVGV